MWVKKQQLESYMEQLIGSKLGKEHVKAVYDHPVYLTYTQSTSWETLGWMMHKPESRLPGEISITSDNADNTTLMWESKELKNLLLKVKEEREKVGLKLSIEKTKIMASSPITSWKTDGITVERETLFSWAPKLLLMVTAAVK